MLLQLFMVSNLIIQCALPISFVDHPAFRAFLADMDPKYSPPVRQTVTNSILPQTILSHEADLLTREDTSEKVEYDQCSLRRTTASR